MVFWWETAAELGEFFDTTEGFAQAATFSTTTVSLIFDNAFADDLNVKGSLPVATARTADITGLSEGATLPINAVAYTVMEKKADGTGTSVIVLQSQ